MSEEVDPLDQRDDDAEEVENRRILESMNEAEQLQQFATLLQDETMRDFLWRLIEKCNVFSDPMNANFGLVAHGLGKAAIGKWLLKEINEADPEAWRQMQLKAAKVAALQRREELRKKGRRGNQS